MAWTDAEKRLKWERDRYVRDREVLLARKRAAYAKDPDKFKRRVSVYRKDNPERVSETKAKWYAENRPRADATKREWMNKNKDRVLASRAKRRENGERQKNNERAALRWASDAQYKIGKMFRSRVVMVLRGQRLGGSITARLMKALGCSLPALVEHLESLWEPGMSWENHGIKGWHIDHIRPLASFDLTVPEQFNAAWHHTNLQPLWWHQNIKKGAKC